MKSLQQHNRDLGIGTVDYSKSKVNGKNMASNNPIPMTQEQINKIEGHMREEPPEPGGMIWFLIICALFILMMACGLYHAVTQESKPVKEIESHGKQ